MGGKNQNNETGSEWKGAGFVPRKKELTKAEKIKKEVKRLNKVFAELDKNKFAAVQSLVKLAAFYAISLDELQDIINEKGRDGYEDEYKNGANQSGKKQSVAAELHATYARNQTAIIKQLSDLAPQEKRKDGKLAAFQRE